MTKRPWSKIAPSTAIARPSAGALGVHDIFQKNASKKPNTTSQIPNYVLFSYLGLTVRHKRNLPSDQMRLGQYSEIPNLKKASLLRIMDVCELSLARLLLPNDPSSLISGLVAHLSHLKQEEQALQNAEPPTEPPLLPAASSPTTVATQPTQPPQTASQNILVVPVVTHQQHVTDSRASNPLAPQAQQEIAVNMPIATSTNLQTHIPAQVLQIQTPHQIQPQTQPQVQTRIHPQLQPKTQAHVQIQIQPQLQPQAQVQTQIQPQLQPQTQAQIPTQLQVQPQSQVQTQIQSQLQPKPQAQAQVQVQVQVPNQVQPRLTQPQVIQPSFSARKGEPQPATQQVAIQRTATKQILPRPVQIQPATPAQTIKNPAVKTIKSPKEKASCKTVAPIFEPDEVPEDVTPEVSVPLLFRQLGVIKTKYSSKYFPPETDRINRFNILSIPQRKSLIEILQASVVGISNLLVPNDSKSLHKDFIERKLRKIEERAAASPDNKPADDKPTVVQVNLAEDIDLKAANTSTLKIEKDKQVHPPNPQEEVNEPLLKRIFKNSDIDIPIEWITSLTSKDQKKPFHSLPKKQKLKLFEIFESCIFVLAKMMYSTDPEGLMHVLKDDNIGEIQLRTNLINGFKKTKSVAKDSIETRSLLACLCATTSIERVNELLDDHEEIVKEVQEKIEAEKEEKKSNAENNRSSKAQQNLNGVASGATVNPQSTHQTNNSAPATSVPLLPGPFSSNPYPTFGPAPLTVPPLPTGQSVSSNPSRDPESTSIQQGLELDDIEPSRPKTNQAETVAPATTTEAPSAENPVETSADLLNREVAAEKRRRYDRARADWNHLLKDSVIAAPTLKKRRKT